MIQLVELTSNSVTIAWDSMEGAKATRIYWSDREEKREDYRFMREIPITDNQQFTLKRSTGIPHYFYICPVMGDGMVLAGEKFVTPVNFIQKEQLESLNRGLIAVETNDGVRIAKVTDSTNFHDVSIKGYTGHCILDCYDFNGDGKAEMAVKTAPGTSYPKFYYGSDMDFGQELPYMKRKLVIYLAGDSITQSYGNEERPRCGMGERLLYYLDEGNCYQIYSREDCRFKQEMRYESRHLIVDNCAMAGRSTKSFLNEERLEDIKEHIKEGDYLFICFGHNDAYAAKPERYVPVCNFSQYLKQYVEAARKRGAVPILISPISLCPCKENEEGENGKIGRLLPEYSRKMKEFAEKEGIFFVDMNHLTREYCGQIEEKEARRLYVSDLVHLSIEGADCFARLLANKVKTIIIEGKGGIYHGEHTL